MATLSDIYNLVSDLHERKILDADTTVGQILAIKGDHILNPGQLVGWYVLGGDHYVVVCGLQLAEALRQNPAEMQQPRELKGMGKR